MGEPEKKVEDNILEVKDLKVWFPVRKGVFGFITGYIKAVDGISFDRQRGEARGDGFPGSARLAQPAQDHSARARRGAAPLRRRGGSDGGGSA